MKKVLVWTLAIALISPVAFTACGSKKSSLEKRISKQNKKRKKGGDTNCPIKDC